MFRGEVIMPAQPSVPTSMDPFMKKLYDRPINGKYVLIKRLGRGGFGVVYLGNDHDLPLKLEHQSVDPSSLEDEARKYEAFQYAVGFPKVYWFGWHDDSRVLAFELLGPTLEDLFAYCNFRFSLKTTLLVADQVLVRLEQLHSNAVIHRDIKPQNFLLGTGANGNVIYVTDFGLADEYTISCVKAEKEIPPRSHLVGTASSPASEDTKDKLAGQSPKDDLESLGYLMAFFLTGKIALARLASSRQRREESRSHGEKDGNISGAALRGAARGIRALRQKFRRLAVREGVSNPSNKRSPAVFMLVGKQERAFDDDVARAIRYKDVELKLVRNNIPATVAVTPAKFAMKVSLRHWKGDLHSRSRE
ncbi:casein kinase I [Friedmanniomyces endolithicus]|uniref:non-specific serine/threonine protein kinase n=1 Tax=Rachicladosporium monterosium TaxID=1507873 RepID=A0ABR0L676_9PEZI|nr:casein kinase I [Friedmanniomyces endolithicus]KAK5144109.1 Casein kinase I isoform epsilon [Rachicladosporium monterosium]